MPKTRLIRTHIQLRCRVCVRGSDLEMNPQLMKSSSRNFWTSEIKVIQFFSSISVWVPPRQRQASSAAR